ncbi:MAG: MFS transporter [Pirellulales bacterium]|nr:MFS transporter [Pirellulales bacterium]
MATEPAFSRSAPPTAPPLPLGLNVRLSAMMFLQYAIWGAWLPLFFAFLTERPLAPFTGEQAGLLFGVAAVGAIIAPFLAGQIADRYFSTERFLGLSHLIGAGLIWQLGSLTTFKSLLVFGFFYSLIYAPTLSLTNALAFHHLPDRDRDFGRVRVWGTVGWIVVGIGMGQWLLRMHTPLGEEVAAEQIRSAHVLGMADAFRLSGVLGIILGIYCFFLPHTPPQKGESKFAAGEAMQEIKRNPLLTLFLIAFPVSCIHQFYFVRTEGFLGHLKVRSALFDSIFGVGGGPMTIGQISELIVLAVIPLVVKRYSRKTILSVGLLAYVVRFAVFAYLPEPVFVVPALALHGLCFGCFFFLAFLIVDENTSSDVRASAQSLFNLIVLGLGVIVGNIAAGQIDKLAKPAGASEANFRVLFGVPMWVSIACLLALWLFYPSQDRTKTPA